MSEWISVEGRLPYIANDWKKSNCKLVYCPEIKCIFTAVYNSESKSWEYFGAGGGAILDRITHWIPLPPPPL